MKTLYKKNCILLSCFAALMGCATHHARVVETNAVESYRNRTSTSQFTVAAETYRSASEARSVLGSDVTRKGFLPVQLILANRNADADTEFIVSPSTILLRSNEGSAYSPISGLTMARTIAGTHVHHRSKTAFLNTPVVDVEGGDRGLGVDTPVLDMDLSERGLEFDTILADIRVPIPFIPTRHDRNQRYEKMRDDFETKEMRYELHIGPGQQKAKFVYFQVSEPNEFQGMLQIEVLNKKTGQSEIMKIPVGV